MGANIKNSVITAFFLFALLYAFTAVFGPIPFSVNSITTNKLDLYTSTGEGEANATPDTAMITLGVTKQADSVAEAQKQVNEISSNISKDLKLLGIDIKNIKTTNYNVSPEYDFQSGRQIAKGYIVSQNLEVKLQPIEKANQAIDKAVARGATNVSGVTFVLDDQKRKELEKQARKMAIEEAKKKAKETSALAGIKLGKIVNIYENNYGYPQPVYSYDAKLSVSEQAENPTQLNPGENTIKISVSLQYQTL